MSKRLEKTKPLFKGPLRTQRDEVDRAALSLRMLSKMIQNSVSSTVDLVSLDSTPKEMITKGSSAQQSKEISQARRQVTRKATPRSLSLVQLREGWDSIQKEQSCSRHGSAVERESWFCDDIILAERMLSLAKSHKMHSASSSSATMALSNVKGVELCLNEVIQHAKSFRFSSIRAERCFTPYG